MKSLSVTIQMKAIQQYFSVVLFIVLYKALLTFEFADEILKCDHSNKGCRKVLHGIPFFVQVLAISHFQF